MGNYKDNIAQSSAKMSACAIMISKQIEHTTLQPYLWGVVNYYNTC